MRRTSLNLLATLFLMHARNPLASLTTWTHCRLLVRLLPTRTLWSSSAELLSGRSPLTCAAAAGYSPAGAAPGEHDEVLPSWPRSATGGSRSGNITLSVKSLPKRWEPLAWAPAGPAPLLPPQDGCAVCCDLCWGERDCVCFISAFDISWAVLVNPFSFQPACLSSFS